MKFERKFTAPGSAYKEIKWRATRCEIRDVDGGVVFEQDGVVVPEHWSQTAADVLAQKYFRRAGVPLALRRVEDPRFPSWLQRSERSDGALGGEWSAEHIFHRMAGAWTYWGWEGKYFATENDARIFYDEVKYMLAAQVASPNSPQWFNTGLHWAYGIDGPPQGHYYVDPTTNQVVESTSAYERPQPHACFIQSVEDDLVNPGGVMDLWVREARLFKYGSGTGSNFSKIRGRGEPLSGGGTSSGVMSFLQVGDRAAGVIKSAGTCLAPDQHVYTASGPVKVKELAELGKDFITLSWDPPAKRFKAKTARAWLSGQKLVVRVVTDKGEFKLSSDHPVLLNGNVGYVDAGKLRPGQSIFACSIYDRYGYTRVGLKDGNASKDFLHRMVARDVLGWNIDGLSVHHKNDVKHDCRSENLELMTQSEHAGLHGRELASTGAHPFQVNKFDVSGRANGMHASSTFWKNREAVAVYKEKQRRAIKRDGRASQMQDFAADVRVLNTILRVRNLGGDVSSVESYIRDRVRLIGMVPSRSNIRRSIKQRYGTWDAVIVAMDARNHTVVRVEIIGIMPVYDVEVDCPTDDDKSINSGHNFLIWPNGDLVGRGVVVSNTRRAAKMCVLDADHPDVEEFVTWKVREEDKVADMVTGSAHARVALGAIWGDTERAGDSARTAAAVGVPPGLVQRALDLRAQGLAIDHHELDADWQGEAYQTVSGQNSNNSVRVTDEFMRAVAEDKSWDLTWRTTGAVAKTVRAKDLWDKMCLSAWACADPGLQFHDTINDWHTCPGSGPIRASNPCSEFLFLDNTACNLASINLGSEVLRPKVDDSDVVDLDAYEHAVRLWTVILDISVTMAQFPSREIARESYDTRTLGLGYANLGGLLMSRGVAYDSDHGRGVAAALTAVMTGTAYATSAEMAGELGAFPHYAKNRDPMMEVVKNHMRVAGWTRTSSRVRTRPYRAIRSLTLGENLRNRARRAGNLAVTRGEGHGFRNAQVTCIAPTGTIAIVMDCDTTGVEPDFALVKHKKLAGGGSMTLENTSVVRALLALKYAAEDAYSVSKYVSKTNSIEGAPHVAKEHLAVFDCANPTRPGGRCLSPEAHVLMVAAVQPFVSGGVSKTINLPRDATVADCSRVYRTAWELGVKCVALYRDGSKLSQPLTSSSPRPPREELEDAAETSEAPTALLPSDSSWEVPKRRRLPVRRRGYTQKAEVGGLKLYLRTGEYPGGALGEIFLDVHKEGATLRSILNSFAQAVSLGLQYGVPLDEFVDAFTRTRFEPAGPVVGSEGIKFATSVLDYIFRQLGADYLGRADLAHVVSTLENEVVPAISAPASVESAAAARSYGYEGEACGECGNFTMIRSGTCLRCDNCGATSGCS